MAQTTIIFEGDCAEVAVTPNPDGTLHVVCYGPDAPPEPTPGYLLLSADELAALPTEGPAWEAIVAAANGPHSGASLTERAEPHHNAKTLMAALVYARTDDPAYWGIAAQGIQEVMDAPFSLGDVLAACRNLAAYPLAADLIRLGEANPSMDAEFRAWLAASLATPFSGGGGGGTIRSIHYRRPNNWGTHAGASRIAAALYLGDHLELEEAALTFHGYLGDRDAYASFTYGDLDWQANPAMPVGVNPFGAQLEIGGAMRNVDGVLPDDQRRQSGVISWPPAKENYVWEALQGAFAQAWLLRRDYQSFDWEDQALERAVSWLHQVCGYPAEGDDTGTPWLANFVYGTTWPTAPARAGKNGLGILWQWVGG